MSTQTESAGSGAAPDPKRTMPELTTGDLNVMALIALASCVAAFLCAVVFLGSMTYTLVHYRSWDPLAAFFVSVVFALIALLSSFPLLASQNEISDPLPGRCAVWGTCLVLAGLQCTAAVLGDASFSLSAVIGLTTVLGIACFTELAGHCIAES